MSSPDDLVAGRYLLLERVGSGGMGVVWRAHDERLGREVALKELRRPPDLDPAEAEVAAHRAMREAQLTARLHHPHAVPVFDVVEHEGRPCLVMQYFPSRSLAELLAQRGTLPAAEVARLGSEVAAALTEAHRVGVVHRDVKPANVLVADDGTAKITDFGIAHAMGDVSITSTGMVNGTPAYLAPEVARGERASPASDVFSLGSTLYAALEGTAPFGSAENVMALLHRVAAGEVPPPVRSGPLAPALVRMLATRPGDRPSMAEVAQALASVDADPDVGPTAIAPAAPVVPATADESTVAAAPPMAFAPAAAAEPTAAAATTPPHGVDALWSDAEPEEEPPARRRRRPVVVMALAALVAVLALGLALGRGRGEDPTAARPSTSATGSSQAAPSTAPSPSRTPSKTATKKPTPSPSRPAPTATPSPSPPDASRAPASPTGAELAKALRGYYALLPGDLDAGWARLTERYQRTTAGSRRTYGSFWGSVDEVRLSDVSGKAPGSVTATVRYAFEDGRVFVERTSYRLVESDGVLKIDRSEVLESRQL